MRHQSVCEALLISLVAVSLSAAPAFAQSSSQTQPSTPSQSSSESGAGKLKIHVAPKQAYVFVDGKPYRDGSHTIKLNAGNHKISVHNYGYQPNTQDVQVTPGKTTNLNVSLQVSGDKVSGPFGDIMFKGHPRAAVLLNGDTPKYFVGHVDEFDWDWIWHQRLLVHPGTYHITIDEKDKTVWSGDVTVKAGERVKVDLNHNGKTKEKEFRAGNNLPPQPRFRAGIASATVAVSPVSGQLSAENTSLQCGDQSTLKWSSADAADTSISNVGEVPPQGDKTVSPTKTTTYELTAKGPGGTATQSVNVNVNTEPKASIAVSQPEIHYHKIGDKVVQQDSATLNWSASNASSVKVDPLGKEGATGNETITANPKQENEGPINETNTYTVTATNACGGTTTQTAELHVVGSIDPPPALQLTSTFYPTAYPTKAHPRDGLVASEAKSLDDLADRFKDYQQYDHKGTLLIVAHADMRGSSPYNQELTERRAQLIKDYLVEHGVPADKIEVQAKGKEDELDKDKVQELVSQNQAEPTKWMKRNKKATWLAYNRRADIVLEPRGTESAETYPAEATDARVLWQEATPSLRKVQQAEQGTSASLTSRERTPTPPQK